MAAALIMYSFIIQFFNTVITARLFLYPLAELCYPYKTRKAFILFNIIRFILLIMLDILALSRKIGYFYFISVLDILSVFIGALVIIPILTHKKENNNKQNVNLLEKKEVKIQPKIKILCKKCGNELKVTDSKCPNCGSLFSKENIEIKEIINDK